jgi:hypothetical protein
VTCNFTLANLAKDYEGVLSVSQISVCILNKYSKLVYYLFVNN